MHFVSLKAQDRRIGGWNWPRITRIKQIFADFSNSRHEQNSPHNDENRTQICADATQIPTDY